MTQDVASLGIKVTTKGAKDAARDLDNLSKEAAQAEKRAISLGKAWGIALGAGAAAVIVGGVKAIIRNTIEAEKVQARLENRVRALGTASAQSVKQVDALATSLQNSTTFDDEKLKSAATSLLAFNNIKADNFERAMRAATDLAADTGDDLVATAEKVGKALNNPTTAMRSLRDVGIQFSTSQAGVIKELVETGRTAEAQNIILGELERRYKGAAESARNTLGGALAALKNSFGNLLEGEGGVNDATKGINGFTDTLNSPEVKRGAQAIVGGVFSIIAALGSLIGTLANATSALNEFFAANDKKGLNSLTNKRNDLEADLFRTQRRSGQGLSDSNDPLGKLLGRASGRDAKVASIKAEIAEVERLITVRNKEATQAAAIEQNAKTKVQVVRRGQGQFGNVLGTGEFAALPDGIKDKKPKKARAGGKEKISEEAREAARLLEQYNDLTASLEEQIALHGETTEVAKVRYDLENGELSKLTQGQKDSLLSLAAQRDAQEAATKTAEEGKRLTESLITPTEDLNRLRAEAAELLQKGAISQETYNRAVEAYKDPGQQLLEDLEFELQLLKMTNAERATAIQLRGLDTEQVAKYGDAIRAKNSELERGAKAAELQAAAERGLSDAIFDVASGAKSAKDAVKDFFDDFAKQIMRMIADNWAKKIGDLFSGGAANGGQGGGTDWFSLIVSAFGGANAKGNAFNAGNVVPFAKGGVFDKTTMFPMSGGRTGMLGEAGPEAILPLHRGPDGKLGVKAANDDVGGSRQRPVVNNNTTFILPHTITPQSQSQVAARSQSVQSRAARRN